MAEVVGWVPGPTERGTLTLIWSCVITIFACTWTVLHLNVPAREDSSWTVASRKARWMAINIIFPEFVFSKAVCDLRLALQELREFDEYLRYNDKTIEWTTRHESTDPWDSLIVIKWSWEIEYPDGWYGLLYDLLRLERPPHLRRISAGNMLRSVFPFRSLPRRFAFTSKYPDNHAIELEVTQSFSSQPNLQNKAKGPEDRQPSHGLATEDHGQTSVEQRHSESIHETLSPESSSKRDGQARVDGGSSAPAASPDDQSIRSSNLPSPDPGLVPQTTQSRSTYTRTISQKWTIVHSFYAQMGGLVSPVPHGYSPITASHLTRRFKWHQEDTTHPIMHLVLGKDDILDKSKADWLLKSLAVLQVTWIIINVIVRHVTRLPISQIEIATIAFAVMAVLIYLANWWKPKDVSQPTMLQFSGRGDPVGKSPDRKQHFLLRLSYPARELLLEDSFGMGMVRRVANDIVWLEGDIPLPFYLMAGSSLVFGGIHCLAWNLEFPTRDELICWRVASLASAVLPVVGVGITITTRFVIFGFSDHYLRPRLSEKLKIICSVGSTQLFTRPAFLYSSSEAQDALLRMPKELRNYEMEPTAEDIEQWGPGCAFFPLNWQLALFDSHLQSVLAGSYNQTGLPKWKFLAEHAEHCKAILKESPEILEFWRDYEDFLRSKHPYLSRPVADGPITTYLQEILEELGKVSTQAISFGRWTTLVTGLVSMANFILYTAARLTILALLFTSLRAAPAGLYQDTAWSRFLPKIS